MKKRVSQSGAERLRFQMIKIKWLVCFTTILLLLVACSKNRSVSTLTPEAEVDSPQDVARIFFDAMQSSKSDAFDDDFMSLYFTDDFVHKFEADRAYLEGQSFEKLTFNEPVKIDGYNAFVKVELRTTEGKHQTSYIVFLKKESTWRVDDVRRLFAPASIAYVRLEALKAKSDLSPQEQRELQHLNRAYLTDDELVEAFQRNKAKFMNVWEQFYSQDQIKLICRDWLEDQYFINDKNRYIQVDEVERTLAKNGIDKSNFDRFNEALDQLEIECIERDDSSNVRFLKVGILDYFVWYVYVPDGELPWDRMTRGGPYVESIDEHWYIFREPIKRVSNR
jgi:hypothetical protein